MTHATGTFEITLTPTGHAPDPSLGSLALAKTYHGGLEATAKGEMLSAGNPASGNAGYVAIERITGTLDGRAGSFALMQLGTMTAGSAPSMTILIAPGSGTGALEGISGTMAIVREGGKHSYVLEYTLG
ncbi:MAG: hypothetical protein JWN73_3369 [Betaproteobacteria bacterium]|nr:hypothetical protein [Betaproteobacteria bacterium]